MSGTCSASRRLAFSGYGSASPYEDEVVEPEWQETTTTSAPAAFIRGTMTRACSTMPGKRTLPSTFALSQIATPGVTRPRMPTVTDPLGRAMVLRTYGGKTG